MLERWLSYDSVSLIPTHISTLEHRAEADTSVQLGPVKLSVPIIAAPMPDVCDFDMAAKLWTYGALGIANRFDWGNTEDGEPRWTVPSLYQGTQVGIALSPKLGANYDSWYDKGYRIWCLDTANGASELVRRAIGALKDKYPDIFVIAGNVASVEAFYALEGWGADGIRVGIAGGSVCATKTETGIYSPMASAIMDITGVGKEVLDLTPGFMNYYDIYRAPRKALLIADGGIRSPSDMCKALALGADACMLGGALAGTKESPGKVIVVDGKKYKILRGAASFSVQKENGNDEIEYNEGSEVLVEYKGSVEKVISRFAAGLRSSMSYMNSRTLEEYRRNVKVVEV